MKNFSATSASNPGADQSPIWKLSFEIWVQILVKKVLQK
jgi:hypothetical protein